MPAPERGPVHELLARADVVAARYDAVRVLADCPCSGCNATRGLADVNALLDRIEAEARGAIERLQGETLACIERRDFEAAHPKTVSLARCRAQIETVDRVRRAARGGREGSESE